MEDIKSKSLEQHEKYRGKWEIKVKTPLLTKENLSTFYSPGVAEPCIAINKNPSLVYKYTNISNTMAIISDGSAILGLGNIGPRAGLPVMESKAAVLKTFADVDTMPLVIGTQDTKEIINFCKYIAPSLSAIMLEDIAAPRCVEIERALEKELDIPVFHDDQHGTAIVCCAALINAAKVVGKNLKDLSVVVSGTGAAGSAIINALHNLGITKIRAFNLKGVVHEKNPEFNTYNFLSLELLPLLNKDYTYNKGTMEETIIGTDVFIGVSAPNILTTEMVKSMNKDAIIFALANPNPEILPDVAIAAGAKVVGTGRGDFANQINNVLAFPGIFRGALDAGATKINTEMKNAAVYAIANIISINDLSATNILPDSLNKDVVINVAKAVKDAAIASGVVRK